MQTNKKLIYGISIAVLVSLIFSFFFYAGFLSNIQLKLSDGLYGGKKSLNNVIIIAIDDKSLQEIGRWPWNRDNFAKLINKLNESAVVAIDVAFFESSNYGNENQFQQNSGEIPNSKEENHQKGDRQQYNSIYYHVLYRNFRSYDAC